MTVSQPCLKRCLKRRLAQALRRDHALALLQHAVIGPPQMRRRAAYGRQVRRAAIICFGVGRAFRPSPILTASCTASRRRARRRHGRGKTADKRRRSRGRCRAARSACCGRHRRLHTRAHRNSAARRRFRARAFFSVLIFAAGEAEPAEPVGARLADGVVIEWVEGVPRGGPKSPRRSRSTIVGRRRCARGPQNPARAAAAPACRSQQAPLSAADPASPASAWRLRGRIGFRSGPTSGKLTRSSSY